MSVSRERYRMHLELWIEETQNAADTAGQRYFAERDRLGAGHPLLHGLRHDWDVEVELMDDLCDVYYRKFGETYLDVVERREAKRLAEQAAGYAETEGRDPADYELQYPALVLVK